MNPQVICQKNIRRGSIYLIVLVTVAVVTTMVLTGIALRQSTNARYRMATDYSTARYAVRSAAEAVLVQMDRNKDDFLAAAKTGIILPDTALGNSTIALTAIDKNTGLAVDNATEIITVTATGSVGSARSMIQFDLESVSDYLRMLVEHGATSYWPFDETTGAADANDVLSGFDGLYGLRESVGTQTFLDAKPAPEFSTNDSILRIDHEPNFLVTQGTIIFWVRANDVTLKEKQGLFSKENDGSAQFFQAMYFEDGQLVLEINDSLPYLRQKYRIDAEVFKDADWHHVAYTFGTYGVRIFIDGKRVFVDYSHVVGLYSKIGPFERKNEEDWLVAGRNNKGIPGSPLAGSIARFAFFPVQIQDDNIKILMEGQLEAKRFAAIEGSFTRAVE